MSTANEIGARLRHERQSRGLSLRSVAQSLGVSASLISQVETGKTQPSVTTLYALASLMSISVDDLLGLEAERGPSAPQITPQLDLQRRGENPVIEMENGVRWERLAMGGNGPADVMLVTYQPGASSSLEGRLMRHVGVEYAYMLSGAITLRVEFDTHVIGPGDSLHFDSARPHMFSNDGREPATGLWLVVGRRNNQLVSAANGRNSPTPSAPSHVEVLKRLDTVGSSDLSSIAQQSQQTVRPHTPVS
ncbi:cupin domain-containing protein [Microbacterium sp. LWS13-1.2]|uniref:Helix-turn-helix domain-containing protein n=1 Tax=Microbacterium sp. LWS13-1.2 TaxID=3135264 RepID=A0AAU6SBI4_9MICO